MKPTRYRRQVSSQLVLFTCCVGLAALASACAPSADVDASLPDQVSAISGKAIERLDEPPFTYLKLRTEQGLVWVAVPAGARAVGDQVHLTGCVAAKNLKLRASNSRLPRVYLGTVAAD